MLEAFLFLQSLTLNIFMSSLHQQYCIKGAFDYVHDYDMNKLDCGGYMVND